MPTTIGQLLLVCALLAWWLMRQQQADPVVSICHRCGDLVQHAPYMPACCPSCGAILF